MENENDLYPTLNVESENWAEKIYEQYPKISWGKPLKDGLEKLLKFVISLIDFLLWSVIEIEMCFQGEGASSS